MFKKIHMFRLRQEKEIIGGIASYCKRNKITSGVVIGIIGAVSSVKLNFMTELPGKFETKEYPGPLEIVCGQGSIALKDSELIIHIHLQVSNRTECRGGHLVEGTIFSTAEIVIGELDYQLHRYFEKYTGINELVD